MIPQSPDWSDLTSIGKYKTYDVLKPPPLRGGLLQATSLGPESLYDSKNKLNSNYWVVYRDNANRGKVYISKGVSGVWQNPKQLFIDAGSIEELCLTFDQLGNPIVFYRLGTDIKIYWFNPLIEQYELKNLAVGDNISCNFDVQDDVGVNYSDAMVFYVRGDKIYMRVQRDRFETEYLTPITDSNLNIKSCGMRVDNRFQVVYRYNNS